MYLASSDYSRFEVPRKIINYENLKISNRNAIRVWVDRPILGQDFGYGDRDIFDLYLIGRVDDSSLVELDSFPISVFVLILKNGENDRENIDSFINLAWANLYE
jgi:hypothetical protein